jgi:hypothetical protein
MERKTINIHGGSGIKKGDLFYFPRRLTRWERFKRFFGFHVPSEQLMEVTSDVTNKLGECILYEPFEDENK